MWKEKYFNNMSNYFTFLNIHTKEDGLKNVFSRLFL